MLKSVQAFWKMLRYGFLPLDSKGYAIFRGMQVRGYPSPKKLYGLLSLSDAVENVPGSFLEIGSAWGRSTVAMAVYSKREIWSIDPHIGGVLLQKEGKKLNTWDSFLKTINKFGLNDYVRPIRATTQEVVNKKLIPDHIHFAFAFIDGLHTAEGVIIDLTFALSKIKPGGMIVLDDFFEPVFKDYRDAIESFAEQHNLKLRLYRDWGLVAIYV